ncbi:hypothetical protein [Mycobacteroides abscessus]|uniref:hypothetical protein n=1 Tax=Mycobacteroides abscessus TaxID=36809 RepID=UPI001F276D2B|nr:hypothetical protein [Mycobacteroides abscessus]
MVQRARGRVLRCLYGRRSLSVDFARISGYLAAAVQLRQGHRTDLYPIDFDTAPSIDDTAVAIATATTEANRLRVFFEFLRGSEAAGPAATLLEPGTTRDR